MQDKRWRIAGLGVLVTILFTFLIFPSGPGSELIAFSPGTDGQAPPEIGRASEKHPKLSSALNQMLKAWSSNKVTVRPLALPFTEDRIRVVIEAKPGLGRSVARQVTELGGKVEAVYLDLVQASMPPPLIETVAAWEKVRFVRLPFSPLPLEIVSEGKALIGADDWQGRLGLTGKGVKIGILDVGFKGYSSLLGSELPPSVVVKSFRADRDIEAGEDHGTACAEIIHDIAPEAQLYLVNVETEVEWGLAVGWLISQEVDIISHSLGWFAGPGDGTGFFGEAVKRVRDNGILWVNAAGNAAQNHWSGIWQDPDADGLLNFTPQENANPIQVNSGEEVFVFLRWDDPWEGSTNDYDLYLLDQEYNVVARSENSQSGFQNPIEWIRYYVSDPGTYYIVVKNAGGAAVVDFDLFAIPGDLGHSVAAGSILSPADAYSAIAVGAVYWENPDELQTYSSRGPTRDGRVKPDFVAPDGVSTQTYYHFFGTSAATPHIAGAAALIKQLHPEYTADQIESFLTQRAIDLGEANKDNLFGWGRLDLTLLLGNLTGQVYLEGRDKHDGIRVFLDGLTGMTGEDGKFVFSRIPMGRYNIEASAEGYLPGRRVVEVSEETLLPALVLLGGDVDKDEDIDIADLLALAGGLGGEPLGLDLNVDGRIDIRDLVIAAKNFGAKESPWR